MKRPGPHGGTVYVVAGNGGARTGGPLDRPLIVADSLAHGAVFVKIAGGEQRARNVQAYGTIGDDFRVDRGPLRNSTRSMTSN